MSRCGFSCVKRDMVIGEGLAPPRREFGRAFGCISVGGDVLDAPRGRKELFDCTKIVCAGRAVGDVSPYKYTRARDRIRGRPQVAPTKSPPNA